MKLPWCEIAIKKSRKNYIFGDKSEKFAPEKKTKRIYR